MLKIVISAHTQQYTYNIFLTLVFIIYDGKLTTIYHDFVRLGQASHKWWSMNIVKWHMLEWNGQCTKLNKCLTNLFQTRTLSTFKYEILTQHFITGQNCIKQLFKSNSILTCNINKLMKQIAHTSNLLC